MRQNTKLPTEFMARIIVFNHPAVIAPGYTPEILFHDLDSSKKVVTAIAGTIVELISLIDPKTGSIIKNKPEYIRQGDKAYINIRLHKQYKVKPNSHFVMIDSGTTVADGSVMTKR